MDYDKNKPMSLREFLRYCKKTTIDLFFTTIDVKEVFLERGLKKALLTH